MLLDFLPVFAEKLQGFKETTMLGFTPASLVKSCATALRSWFLCFIANDLYRFGADAHLKLVRLGDLSLILLSMLFIFIKKDLIISNLSFLLRETIATSYWVKVRCLCHALRKSLPLWPVVIFYASCMTGDCLSKALLGCNYPTSKWAGRPILWVTGRSHDQSWPAKIAWSSLVDRGHVYIWRWFMILLNILFYFLSEVLTLCFILKSFEKTRASRGLKSLPRKCLSKVWMRLDKILSALCWD